MLRKRKEPELEPLLREELAVDEEQPLLRGGAAVQPAPALTGGRSLDLDYILEFYGERISKYNYAPIYFHNPELASLHKVFDLAGRGTGTYNNLSRMSRELQSLHFQYPEYESLARTVDQHLEISDERVDVRMDKLAQDSLDAFSRARFLRREELREDIYSLTRRLETNLTALDPALRVELESQKSDLEGELLGRSPLTDREKAEYLALQREVMDPLAIQRSLRREKLFLNEEVASNFSDEMLTSYGRLSRSLFFRRYRATNRSSIKNVLSLIDDPVNVETQLADIDLARNLAATAAADTVGAVFFWCCCVGIIAAVVASFAVGGGGSDKSNKLSKSTKHKGKARRYHK